MPDENDDTLGDSTVSGPGDIDWDAGSDSLNRKYRKLYATADDAFQRKNYAYAIKLYRSVLKKYPGALDVREKLREAQFTAIGCSTSVFRQVMTTLLTLPSATKARAMMTGNKLAEALDIAEGMMTKDCTASTCINLVATIAERAEMPETVMATLEWGVRFHNKNQMMMQWLANTYMENERSHKAVEIGERLVKLAPNNQIYKRILKDANAKASMEKGGWTELEKNKGDYRDVVRDKKVAAELEQAGRSVRTEQGLEVLIAGKLEEIEKQDTVEKRQELASFYAEAKDYDAAIEQYTIANDMAGGVDPNIEREIVNLQVKIKDKAIQEMEAQLEQMDQAEAEANAGKLEELKAERDAMQLESLRERVRRFPNQHEDRVLLAQILVREALYDEALGHLQTLSRNPRFKISSQLLMGECFMHKGQHDMAVEQFESVIKGTRSMDGTRKEATYNLGHCQRQMGDEEAAMKSFKAIYSADLNYRDVRELVENPNASQA